MLEHLRVLDLTDERGLLCGRLLADLGADVVQVEPRGGSSARSVPPVATDGSRTSMYWETFAAGKRGIEVDLDEEAAVGRLRRLAGVADIVVTSWPREVVERLGLDPVTLRADRPSRRRRTPTPTSSCGRPVARSRAVSMKAVSAATGHTAHTRILLRATSPASPRVSVSTAPLVAL